MALIDMIQRRGRAPVPTGPEKAPSIATKIGDAEQQLEALRAERPELALDAVSGVDGADAHLVDLDRRIAEIERTLGVLTAAHEAADAADKRMFRQQAAAMFNTQVSASKKHLKARDDAGRRLTKAIEDAVSAYQDLVARSHQAMAANPVGGSWPGGSLCGATDLYLLVDEELFRLGDKIELGKNFPRAHAHLLHHPANMASLADRVARASEICIDNLMQRAPK
jgi:hypothetical protein